MFAVGKVTPEEKAKIEAQGWEVETLSQDWDGMVAEGDDREMVKIHIDANLIELFQSDFIFEEV